MTHGLTFDCVACSLSVAVTLHTRESGRAWAWYMLPQPVLRCPSCGHLLSLPELPASQHAARYWWATFSVAEQRELGGDHARWWSSLGAERREELRAKMRRGDTER